MHVFFPGCILFILGFVIHWIIWRIRMPRRQTKVILTIFSAVLEAGLAVFWFLGQFLKAPGFPVLQDIWQYLHIALFHITLTLTYVINYSGLEADSPTLVMVMEIFNAGSQGLSQDAFYEIFNDDRLVKPRVRDLVRDKHVDLEGDRYRITRKGVLLIKPIIFYRKILNVPKGG